MKFLSIALLLYHVGVGRSDDSDGYYHYEESAGEAEEAAGESEEAAGEAEEAAGEAEEGWYPEEGYYTRGPSTEPKPIRHMFDVSKWDINDIVDEEEHEEGTRYVFDDEIIEAVEEDVIPELCYLTPDNITIYNSFLLDRHCLEELDSVGPQCRGFRCELAHYFLEHGARMYMDFLNADSIKAGVEVIHAELSAAFEKLNMCTCGREFLKAIIKCAPFYNSNALFALADNDEFWIVWIGKVLRNVDLKSGSRFFDRLITGVCAESGSGICLNSIFNGLEELSELLVITIEEYEDYDDGDRKYQKSQEKRCDALFGPLRAWTKDDRDINSHYELTNFVSRYLPNHYESERMWELVFNKTAAVTKAFYCEKRCKKDPNRGAMYPCCLRRMLEDDKLFDNLVRVIESIYKVTPAVDGNFEWDGFYELNSDFYEFSYSKEALAEVMTYKLPERLRGAFMRAIHAAKYCEGKVVRCSK